MRKPYEPNSKIISVEAMGIANLLQNTLAKGKDDEHDCLCETGSRPGDTTGQIQD